MVAVTYKINKRPNTVSELRIVFVLVGYFRKSKPNFCNIASLLYDLLKHHQPDKSSIETISWEQKHYSALNTLLHTFAYPNFSKPFILHTGAPGRGWVECALYQYQNDEFIVLGYGSLTL